MMNYKDSGVDVEAGYKAVELIKKHAGKTLNKNVVTKLGGFGGMFSIGKFKMEDPVLVSGTDGVGTKLKYAFLFDKHDTIGIDCVAMCVNDIICCGAKPLFFLDYIACGKNTPERIEQIVKGVSDGCIMAKCALIGGETAEMPGFYKNDEYDIAGFATGIVDKKNIIDGSTIKPGDVIIGLASSGVHSNGFSLVRKLFGEDRVRLSEKIDALNGSLGEELLKPTRIYTDIIFDLISKYNIKGIANITGGGFIENIPRMLNDKGRVKIKKGSWEIPVIFTLIKETGGLDDKSLYNTFNMGIGMVLAVSSTDADSMIGYLKEKDENAYVIGEVEKGEGLRIC